MKRRISLYINYRKVDLDDDSFILFNYAMEDLTNPAIVKNSYTQGITIKGTRNNNRIFGECFRVDKHIDEFNYDPTRKTPFTIYGETDEILESGYCKLDEVIRKGSEVEYSVTLYGGLGSFLYSLAYDADGNERSLADMVYLDETNPDGELDFVINASSVEDAWDSLYSQTEMGTKWEVIQFAPAYEGIPSDFNADKAIVDPTTIGLLSSITKDGKTYHTTNGKCLINLASEMDYWAVKDFRSYLMRPCLNFKKFLEAVANPINNGGFTVDLSLIDDVPAPNANLYLTLPSFPSLGGLVRKTGGLETEFTQSTLAAQDGNRWDIVGDAPSQMGTKITARLKFQPQWTFVPIDDAPAKLYSYWVTPDNTNEIRTNLIFLQLLAYAEDDTLVGGSRIKALFDSGVRGIPGPSMPKELAEICGYTPTYDGDDIYETASTPLGDYTKVSGNLYRTNAPVGMEVTALDVSYIKLRITAYTVYKYSSRGASRSYVRLAPGTVNSQAFAHESGKDSLYRASLTNFTSVDADNIVEYETNENIRSGAVITKKVLLSSMKKPSDYLLSYCKMFGLHLHYDPSTRKVTLMTRNDLYKDEVIDITERIDRSKDIKIKPYVYDAKWYEFNLESVGGAFEAQYKEIYAQNYGVQRIDTGYDFDSNTVNIMEGNAFKSAATILGKSRYFFDIFNSATFVPSPFVDLGNTYTLVADDGDTLDTDIALPPPTATITPWNEDGLNGYDYRFARKMEFRDKDGKNLDGSGVLVFLEGWQTYDYAKVTDDSALMMALDEDMPCWDLSKGSGRIVPIMQRYLWSSSDYTVEDSLDFGVPNEVAIPSIIYEPTYNDEGVTIYRKAWRKYLLDRYDRNTKVMTCRVNLAGLQVNQDLLRKFFWYENSLWVLNKVSNYSLTTYDTVECQFVQVQNKDNYLSGQDY